MWRADRRGNGPVDAAFRAGTMPRIPGGVRDLRAGTRTPSPVLARLARAEIPVRWWIHERTRMVPPHRRSGPARELLPRRFPASPSRTSTGAGSGGNSATRSLFDFLHREVGLSRGSAHYRQVASRLVERFPEIVEPLRDGRLCLSNVPQLARVMTEENRATMPTKFFHCSKQEARQVVAEILPAEVVPTRTVVTVGRADVSGPTGWTRSRELPGERAMTAPESARGPSSSRSPVRRPGCTSRCRRSSWPC